MKLKFLARFQTHDIYYAFDRAEGDEGGRGSAYYQKALNDISCNGGKYAGGGDIG